MRNFIKQTVILKRTRSIYFREAKNCRKLLGVVKSKLTSPLQFIHNKGRLEQNTQGRMKSLKKGIPKYQDP